MELRWAWKEIEKNDDFDIYIESKRVLQYRPKGQPFWIDVPEVDARFAAETTRKPNRKKR